MITLYARLLQPPPSKCQEFPHNGHLQRSCSLNATVFYPLPNTKYQQQSLAALSVKFLTYLHRGINVTEELPLKTDEPLERLDMKMEKHLDTVRKELRAEQQSEGNIKERKRKKREGQREKRICRNWGERERANDPTRHRVKILSDQVHIIGLINIHSFLRYSEG